MSKLDPSEFIKQQHYGVLSTHSANKQGYPFGSVTPYIITSDGDLAIFISDLAEHTHNIFSNPKVCLTITEITDEANPQASPRISCLANAIKANSENIEGLRQRYIEQFPEAELTLQLPGFHFYLLKLVDIRLIGGFGDIKWLKPEQLKLN